MVSEQLALSDAPSAHGPEAFYARVLRVLNDARVPYLIGGTYAYERHTGLSRHTKDLDLFIRERDWPRAARALRRRQIDTQVTYSHWLCKAQHESGHFVDFVFGGGNGLGRVEDDWFPHGVDGVVHGEPVRVCGVEEVIWSKAFLMERERFDGADIQHLLLARGASLDWTRLLWRFGSHWPVLFAHLVLYHYIYPSERAAIPGWVTSELAGRLVTLRPSPVRVTYGPFLSRSQYLPDLLQLGFHDPRLGPEGTMSEAEVANWNEDARAELEGR